MQRDHRNPYDLGPRGGIYGRLGPPPGPRVGPNTGRLGPPPEPPMGPNTGRLGPPVGPDTGRLGPPPGPPVGPDHGQRVLRANSAYPTPYRQQPLDVPALGPAPPRRLHPFPPLGRFRRRPPPPPHPHQIRAFIDNRKRMLNEFLKGPPSAQPGAGGWRGREAALHQERSQLSKEMARSVGSLFEPEYHSEDQQPECLPVAAPGPSPAEGKLSDHLRYVSDFVHGKMDTAGSSGEEGEVVHSAVTEGPYRRETPPAPHATEGYLGRHAMERLGPAPSSSIFQRIGEPHRLQSGEFCEDDLRHSLRPVDSVDSALGSQPAQTKMVVMDEDSIRPLFDDRRTVRSDSLKPGFGSPSSKGVSLQSMPPDWQGQSWENPHVDVPPVSDAADAVPHGNIDSRLEPVESDRSPHSMKMHSPSASPGRTVADTMIVRETQPRGASQLVRRELHPPPRASPDHGSPSVMRHKSEAFHVQAMPLSHCETPENAPASWEKMPLDAVVQMEEKRSRSPAYQREEQDKGIPDLFSIPGLPPHLSVVPMELDSGSQSEGENSARGMVFDSPLPHTTGSQQAKDPIHAHSVFTTTDRQDAPSTVHAGQANVPQEAATEPVGDTSHAHSSRPSPHTPSGPNKSLVVGIHDSGLAFRLVPVTVGLPREALHNMYEWSKGQMDKNITKKPFNTAHSIEVDVRTHVRLLDWIESNEKQASHWMDTDKVEAMKNRFREEVRQEIKLILSAVVENLAIEELISLQKKCPPRLFLATTAKYSKTLDCQLVLEKAGYISTRNDEPRVMSLFQKSARIKDVLRKAKSKRRSVTAVLRELSAQDRGEAVQQHKFGKGNSMTAAVSVGRKSSTEDTVSCIEAKPDQEKSTEGSACIAGKGSTNSQELPAEDDTVVENVGPDSGGTCNIRNDTREGSLNNPEGPPVRPSHDLMSLDELVSGSHSPAPKPGEARTQPDSSGTALAGASAGEPGTMEQPPREPEVKKSALIDGQLDNENSLSLEVVKISIAKPEIAENGLSRVRRVPKEGTTPILLMHLRKWAKCQLIALYSSRSFTSVHSTEISIRTAVKFLDWFQKHGSRCSVQTIEEQQAVLHKKVRNEVRGMLLIVRENLAVEEAKAIKGIYQVKKAVLMDSYQRMLCLNDLLLRMGYVVPRAEEGDEKARDLLKKVDQMQLLIERSRSGSDHATTVDGDTSNQTLQALSLRPLLAVPTPSTLLATSKHDTQTVGEHGREGGLQGVPVTREGKQAHGDRSNSSQSRACTKSRVSLSTSSGSDSSSESSEQRKTKKKKTFEERRRSGHLRSSSRSSYSPRRSRSRSKHTSRHRESSYSETTHGDASSSPVRVSHSLQLRSRSCDRVSGVTPSSDSETERLQQKYADEEDIKLLEMRRKLLQSILDKQQKGKELARLPVQTVAICPQSSKSALSASVQPSSSNSTQNTSVMLSSSVIEAQRGVSAPSEEPASDRSVRSQAAGLGHPSVDCVASVQSTTFECISEDEDTQTASTGLHEESNAACSEIGALLPPLNSTVGYTKDGGHGPMCADSQVMEKKGMCEELEEGEVVSSEDEAPLVIDYMEEGACSRENAKKKQVAAKPSNGALLAFSTLTTGEAVSEETVADKTTSAIGDSVSVCENVSSETIESKIVAALIEYQEGATAEASKEELEVPVSAAFIDQDHPAQDMFAEEKATEVRDPGLLPQEPQEEEPLSLQANTNSSSDIFQCNDGPQAGGSGSGYSTPPVPCVPSIEVSLDAFIAQSKINSQLIQKAFHSSVVREDDSVFAMETDRQRSRGSGRHASGPTNLASAKFALGKKDNWKQTSSFIITVTEETTSGSEDSEDDMRASPPPHPFLGTTTFDGVPPVAKPPGKAALPSKSQPLSIGFKPRSILVSRTGHGTSSAGKSVNRPVTASGGVPPHKYEPNTSKDSSHAANVPVEQAAPGKVGNSIKSSSLRLLPRRGGRVQGTAGSGDRMEVDASSGRGKEPVEKQGQKRELFTGDDGSRPAAKRRTVTVNTSTTTQSEIKSPVKSQWKQVEHEVQEARRQLTRIRAKKCLQAMHTMEADTTKQRAEVKQEQQRLSLLTQQLTSSTQEASELEMKVDLLKKQLAQAKETLKAKQNRIGRLQKEVKSTMTSLSDKKETLNKQVELLNGEKQQLKNYRDLLKGGAFAGVKIPAKSIMPSRKHTSSFEEGGPETAQLGEKGKTPGFSETAPKVGLTPSNTAAAPVQLRVGSPIHAVVHTTPAVNTSSQLLAQPVISDPQVSAQPVTATPQTTAQPMIPGFQTTAPAVTNTVATSEDAAVLIGSTDSSPVTCNMPISQPVASHTEAPPTVTLTTQARQERSQRPSALSITPLVPPPQLLHCPNGFPSPNTVKRNQPIIALERLPDEVFRGKEERREEGEVEEKDGEEEEGEEKDEVGEEEHAAKDVKKRKNEEGREDVDLLEEKTGEVGRRGRFISLHQVLTATDAAAAPNVNCHHLICEEDGTSSLMMGAGQEDSSKESLKEAAVVPTKRDQTKAHSAKMEVIVQRLRNQAHVGGSVGVLSTPPVIPAVGMEVESPWPFQGQQRTQDLPADGHRADDDSGAVAATNEMEETSLESTSKGEQVEQDRSPLTQPELMCWEGKARSSQHSQMEPTYAGLPCIYLSRNGIVQLSEKLRHISDSDTSETHPKLPAHVLKQLSQKSPQAAPAVGVLPHISDSTTTAACGDGSGPSAPSRSGRGLKSYSSPLLCFRSYIASPQFWQRHPYRLKSDTFMSRINPKRVMCRYGLQGVCRDSRCDRQHWKDVTDASNRHVMEELVLLHPQVCGIDVSYLKSTLGPKYYSTLKTLVVKIVDSHIQQVEQKGGDPLLELLRKIKSSVGSSGEIHFITSSHLSTSRGAGSSSTAAQSDGDVPLQFSRPQPPPKEMVEEAVRLDVQQVFGGPLAIPSVRDPEQLSAQEGRYFAPSKVVQIGEMEQYLEEHPHDVETWLSLVEEVGRSFKDETAGLTAAIKTVKRSLQSNPTSVRMHCQCIRLLHLRSEKDGASVGEAVSEAVLTTGKDVPAAAIILEHAWAHELPSNKKSVCLNFIPLVLKHKCKEIGSSDAVELMMVAAQVDIVLRHPERAVTTMKSFLSDHSSSLTPSLCVFTWLCYISVSRLGQLPSSLFTHHDFLDTTQPLRLITKEPFVICFGDWFAQTAQLGQKQRVPLMSSSSHSTPITPQPPTTKLESLHQQWMESFSEALSSCMQNMADLPAEETQRTLQPLWLSIAAVEEACGHTEECVAGLKLMVEASGGRHAFINGYQTLLAAVDANNASQILASAFALHGSSPQMCYLTSKHEALHGNPDRALHCLVTLVESYVEQPCSEAMRPHTAVIIYRKLLGQYVPGDQLSSLPLLAEQRAPREEVGHLWLCYCLLAELLPSSVDHTIKERFANPVDVFEAAVHSQTNSSDRKLVWKEYLLYLRDIASREGASLQDFKSFTSCIQRCLLAVDHKETVAEKNSDCSLQVDDYAFHSEVVEMHVSLLPDQDQPMAYRQWMKILPNSDSIIAKAALMAVRQSHSNIKWVQGWLAAYLQEHNKSVAVWKIAIKLECSLKRYKEARWMFQEALKTVPLSGSLWKEYVMFEVDQMKDLPSTAAKQLPEGVAELFKNAAQNGIRVSDVMQPFMHPAPHKSS